MSEFEIADNILLRYNGAGPSVSIPLNVTEIGPEAFRGNSQIEEVIIHDNVLRIGDRAFRDCYNLTSITMNPLVIGTEAFAGCSPQEINLGSRLKEMQEGAFLKCFELERVFFPEFLPEIPDNAFAYCFSLKRIQLPDSVIRIGRSAFEYCDNLIDIDLPRNLEEIDDSAFSGCYELRSFVMHDHVSKLGKDVFWACNNLERLEISESLTNIPPNAFTNLNSLRELVIHEGVEHIGDHAFMDCPQLTDVYFPFSLKSMEGSAFAECYNLRFPEYIKKYYFNDYYFIHKDHPSFYNRFSNLSDDLFSRVLSSLAFQCRYEDEAPKSRPHLTEVTVPESFKELFPYQFRGCAKLAKITLPDGLREIPAYAFEDCESLEEIHIPDSVTFIDPTAFFGCRSLKRINVPQGIGYPWQFLVGEKEKTEPNEIRTNDPDVEDFMSMLFPEIKITEERSYVPEVIFSPHHFLGTLGTSGRLEPARAAGYAILMDTGLTIPEDHSAKVLKMLSTHRRYLYRLIYRYPEILRTLISREIIPQNEFLSLLREAHQNHEKNTYLQLLNHAENRFSPEALQELLSQLPLT